MSITATKGVWAHSTAKGNARLVLLALAGFAAEEKVQRGDPALAFPSQGTLAEMCNCERSTIQLALETLQASGEIRDTGERHWGRYRGTIEWEVLPHIDLTENQAPDSRSGQEAISDDLTDSPSIPDRFSDDLTDSPSVPDRQVGHKQVVDQVVNPVGGTRSAPSAADERTTSSYSSNDEGAIFDPERVALYGLLADPDLPPFDEKRTAAVQRLRELDGEEITMDMWARRAPALVEALVA